MGVYLLWHNPKCFNKISKDQKDELVDLINSNDGKKLLKSLRKANQTNKTKRSGSGREGDKKPEGGGNWRNKFKQSTKTLNSLKNVMLVLSEKEKTNKALTAAFQSTQTPDATTYPQVTVGNALTTLIGSLQYLFPTNSGKPQRILQKN